MVDEVYHENGEAQLVGFYDKVEQRFYFVPSLTKKNPYQQRKLAVRLGEQVDEEGHAMYGQVNTEYKDGYLQTLRRQDMRHRTLPLKSGLTIVISRAGTKDLPETDDKRKELFIEWISNMSGKFGGTRDYGRDKAGFKFPPKNPGRNIKLDRDLTPEEIAAALEADEKDWGLTWSHDITIHKMPHDEAEQYVRENFVSWGASERDVLI